MFFFSAGANNHVTHSSDVGLVGNSDHPIFIIFGSGFPLNADSIMAAMLDQLNNIIWNEKWWLGDDAKWEDFEPKVPGVYYPRVSDMNWSILVGVALHLFRYVYEK